MRKYSKVKYGEDIVEDVYLIKNKCYDDKRGCFVESFNQKQFNDKLNLNINFIQSNYSISNKDVIRGLHYQEGIYAQSKLLNVIQGSIMDVIVDLRQDSKTFKKCIYFYLSDKNNFQLFIPKGFAHGFVAFEQNTIVQYLVDNHYNLDSEQTIIYNDEELNIDWKIENPILSNSDLKGKTLNEAIYF